MMDAPLLSSRIRRDIVRPPPDLVAAAGRYGAATLHESFGQKGALPACIKPIVGHVRVCGPAVTVQCPPGDNLWLHRAIYVAEPGDVLVVQVGEHYECGYWGEIMAHAALARRLGGLVINGCVRDGSQLAQLAFPVFARGLCIRGTQKDREAMGWINAPPAPWRGNCVAG